MTRSLERGRIVADVAGLALTAEEREFLAHPQVGGVILFARNFASPEQLAGLVAAIHAVRSPPLLVAVDHEGGRVQRFRDGFTIIPAMRTLGRLWDGDQAKALTVARNCGLVLAAELRAHGIDLSFAPVLDLDHGPSGVIGDRAFHRQPAVVSALAAALQAGMAAGGMAACGKHFPGHGHVAADSHVAVPIDDRPLAAIEADDLQPFRRLIDEGLAAVMPAHVIYPDVDQRPAGFSPVWLSYLRRRCGFDGIIFSDDLSMEGAAVAGGAIERGLAAVAAGCDMVLLCNDFAAVSALADGFAAAGVDGPNQARLGRLFRPALAESAAALEGIAAYRDARACLAGLS
ncbi:MAG: beta-N-acetylhexosaminidase [Burkholderiales bacterium]|nr:beta-N-acetylhexosaminidase [Burkholderiales bacterium]